MSVLAVTDRVGRPRQWSLRPGQRRLAQRRLRTYWKVPERLRAICELNRQLLRNQGAG